MSSCFQLATPYSCIFLSLWLHVVDLNNGAQSGSGTIRQVLVTPIAPGGVVRAMPPQLADRDPPSAKGHSGGQGELSMYAKTLYPTSHT